MFWSPRLFAEIVAHLDSFRLVFWRPNSQTGPPNFGSMTSRASRKFLKEGSVPENLKPASVRGKSEASRVSAIRCLGPGKPPQFFYMMHYLCAVTMKRSRELLTLFDQDSASTCCHSDLRHTYRHTYMLIFHPPTPDHACSNFYSQHAPCLFHVHIHLHCTYSFTVCSHQFG